MCITCSTFVLGFCRDTDWWLFFQCSTVGEHMESVCSDCPAPSLWVQLKMLQLFSVSQETQDVHKAVGNISRQHLWSIKRMAHKTVLHMGNNQPIGFSPSLSFSLKRQQARCNFSRMWPPSLLTCAWLYTYLPSPVTAFNAHQICTMFPPQRHERPWQTRAPLFIRAVSRWDPVFAGCVTSQSKAPDAVHCSVM